MEKIKPQPREDFTDNRLIDMPETKEITGVEKVFTDSQERGVEQTPISMLYPVGAYMDWGFSRNTIPDGFLVCEGQEISKDDYPAFFRIGNITEDTYTLPDYTNYFARYAKTDEQINQVKIDTMREITGQLYHASIADNNKGAFTIERKGQKRAPVVSEGTTYTEQFTHFNSSLGVAGQEGTKSPNVGSETAPQHIYCYRLIKVR